jgi:hypothetical protein
MAYRTVGVADERSTADRRGHEKTRSKARRSHGDMTRDAERAMTPAWSVALLYFPVDDHSGTAENFLELSSV